MNGINHNEAAKLGTFTAVEEKKEAFCMIAEIKCYTAFYRCKKMEGGLWKK